MSYLDNVWAQPQVITDLVQWYQQSSAWQTLAQFWQRQSQPRPVVILTGMGASHQVLWPTWLALNQGGIATILVEAGELLHYLSAKVSPASLILVVSQSGESIEIRRLLAALPKGMAVASVTNTDSNFLANHSDFNFPTHAGHEVGVATKTFTSSFALLYLLQRVLFDLPLNPACDALTKVAGQMQQVLEEASSWRSALFEHLAPSKYFAVIGRGPGLVTAMNGALVLQEAVRLPAASYTGGQFRHGPMESVSEQLGAIVITSAGVTTNLNLKLGRDIAARGGRTVLLGQTQATDSETYANQNLGANLFPLDLPAPPEELSPLLSILPIQLLAADLAQKVGITPGEFRWSGKVITAE